MWDLPLHPLVVHFPVVLAVLLPITIVVALWVIRRGGTPRKAWAAPLAVAVALAVSAWIAVETGENQEDRVERVIAEGALHDHEESADRFLVLSGVLAVVAFAGLARGTVGHAARIVAAVGAVGVLWGGVVVGHSGGVLVYREGAASAYATARVGGAEVGRPASERGGDPEKEDRERR